MYMKSHLLWDRGNDDYNSTINVFTVLYDSQSIPSNSLQSESTIFLLYFKTVPTVWYFFHCIPWHESEEAYSINTQVFICGILCWVNFVLLGLSIFRYVDRIWIVTVCRVPTIWYLTSSYNSNYNLYHFGERLCFVLKI